MTFLLWHTIRYVTYLHEKSRVNEAQRLCYCNLSEMVNMMNGYYILWKQWMATAFSKTRLHSISKFNNDGRQKAMHPFSSSTTVDKWHWQCFLFQVQQRRSTGWHCICASFFKFNNDNQRMALHLCIFFQVQRQSTGWNRICAPFFFSNNWLAAFRISC